MAPASARRVSYIIPPPSTPAPRLKLAPLDAPRHGRIGPIVIYAKAEKRQSTETHEINKRPHHPRHRLGVSALALDTATVVSGNDEPEGILYTGGRDGMLVAWDLGIPMRRRSHKYGFPPNADSRRPGHWEIMTGWADNYYDEDEEEENLISDGDVLGLAKPSGGWRQSLYLAKKDEMRFEEQWETDYDLFDAGKSSRFRQCTQAHTDWVNDILLCNQNQTVISGSSDGTVKAWNPHSIHSSYPSTIGYHSDYVRCLTHSPERKWIASGSFDRTIKLWDLTESRPDPLITLLPPENSGPKSSVYALAADPFGRIIASGSPERVVRTWDPRSGKRIGKLVGHTDNIRAILVSEDSRYMLTGSADASIKLWSLASSHRCLHTFTHHTDSVWSLFSSHPSLSIFYSGDRSGLVCKVDIEECNDIADGECIVLCKDSGEPGMAGSEGVNKMVAMDDNLLWTASGSSSVKRWNVPQRRVVRAANGSNSPGASYENDPDSPFSSSPTQRNTLGIELPRIPSRSHLMDSTTSTKRAFRHSITPSLSGSIMSSESLILQDYSSDSVLFGIPFGSLVKLASPSDGFSGFNPVMRSGAGGGGRDPEVATLYSAASILSVPWQYNSRSPLQANFSSAGGPGGYRNDFLTPPQDVHHPAGSARAAYEERDVAIDAMPLNSTPNDVIAGEHGLVRAMLLNDRIHALTVDTAGVVALWNVVRAQCIGVFSREDVSSANGGASEADSSSVRDISPRQALEIVRERIEGEAVVQSWSQADTRIGELTINFLDRCFEAEIFADEAGYGHDKQYSDEYRLNIGKWVLRNLFLGFIREEERAIILRSEEESYQDAYHSRIKQRSATVDSGTRHDSRSDTLTLPRRMASPVTSAMQSFSPNSDFLTPRINDITPPSHGSMASQEPSLPTIPQEKTPTNDLTPRNTARSYTLDPSQTPQPSHQSTSNMDYFTSRRRPSVSGVSGTPVGDDFSGWGGPGTPKPSTTENGVLSPVTPGGFMGRLKNLGKLSKKQASESDVPSSATAQSAEQNDIENDASANDALQPKSFVQKLTVQQLNPPTSTDAPPLPIPSNVSIVITEETPSGWVDTYRGTVGSTGKDIHLLEEVMPSWLIEYLLTNKAPIAPVAKISFVLLPVPTKGDDEDQLPDLLNSNSKLSASRFLRVRKLTTHVQEKLDKMTPPPTTTTAMTTPRLSSDVYSSANPLKPNDANRPRAEDVYEILCNDYVLPLDMTIASVRQFYWRQSAELIMYYRRKRPLTIASAGSVKYRT